MSPQRWRDVLTLCLPKSARSGQSFPLVYIVDQRRVSQECIFGQHIQFSTKNTAGQAAAAVQQKSRRFCTDARIYFILSGRVRMLYQMKMLNNKASDRNNNNYGKSREEIARSGHFPAFYCACKLRWDAAVQLRLQIETYCSLAIANLPGVT